MFLLNTHFMNLLNKMLTVMSVLIRWMHVCGAKFRECGEPMVVYYSLLPDEHEFIGLGTKRKDKTTTNNVDAD